MVGEHVYPSMSRIADFSGSGGRDAHDDATALLLGPWATIPDDLNGEAEGTYMIDIAVADS